MPPEGAHAPLESWAEQAVSMGPGGSRRQALPEAWGPAAAAAPRTAGGSSQADGRQQAPEEEGAHALATALWALAVMGSVPGVAWMEEVRVLQATMVHMVHQRCGAADPLLPLAPGAATRPPAVHAGWTRIPTRATHHPPHLLCTLLSSCVRLAVCQLSRVCSLRSPLVVLHFPRPVCQLPPSPACACACLRACTHTVTHTHPHSPHNTHACTHTHTTKEKYTLAPPNMHPPTHTHADTHVHHIHEQPVLSPPSHHVKGTF